MVWQKCYKRCFSTKAWSNSYCFCCVRASVSAAPFSGVRVSPAFLGLLLVVHPQTPSANSGIQAAQTEVRQINWILPEQKDPYGSGELVETAAEGGWSLLAESQKYPEASWSCKMLNLNLVHLSSCSAQELNRKSNKGG